nr:BTAD domain-containing putative transcriptional regulator [Lentibacillus saliphilus]
MDQALYEALNIRAADYFEAKQDWDAALLHYLKVEKHDRIAQIISEQGFVMLATGRLQSLYERLTEIPEEQKHIYPVLYFFQGEIERYRSLYEEAERHYEKMIRIIPEYDESHFHLIGLAFEGKARIYLDTIQPDKAERFVKQAIYFQERVGASKAEMAKLYQLMAENLLNAGQATKAESWFNRAQLLDLPMEESNLQARIYLRTGRLEKARTYLQGTVQQSYSVSYEHLPQAHRETDILLSIIHAFMGDAEESKKLASNGIQLGVSSQSPFVEACGWMRMGHAVQLLDRYDINLAEQCYYTALNIMETINVSRGKAEPYMGLAILYGKQRQYDRAKESALKGLKETEAVNDRWLSALIKLCLGITEIYNDHFDEAIPLFEDVQQSMNDCGDRYIMMATAFWQAYAYHEKNMQEAFETAITTFLHHIQIENHLFFIKEHTIFGPTDLQTIGPLLIKAKTLEIEPQSVSRLMHEVGIDDHMSTHPGYTLSIQTFGPLTIWLGQNQVGPQDWQREKAKELLALLVVKRHSMLLKEDILQQLWPEEDEQTANKKFKVTFNTLLKTLEPARKARETPYFIARKGSAYGLNQGFELDIIQFEKCMSQGLDEKDPRYAKELLEKGLVLYHDDFLADMRLADWTVSERERLQLLYLHGAEKMAQISVRLLDFKQCIDWCERILTIDQTWEEAYRLMMYSYYQNNNRPQAIKWFEKCSYVLQKELGVEPMAPTQDMYQLIMGQTQKIRDSYED